jgi:tRNA pseudouridine55 synthase
MQLFGLLNVHKPPGVTSRRVVDRVQKLVRPAKVGHAGTLDPLASGVLVLGIGQATRLVEYVQEMPKQYEGTFLLGRTSPTEDVDGPVTELRDAPVPTRRDLEQAARRMTGQIEQRPPSFSALKVEGQRAYDLARAGQEFELPARQVRIFRLEIARYEYPELGLDVECSGGTYVRSLGRDLADAVGTGAVMSALVRKAIGPFRLDEAIDPERLTKDNLPGFLLPPRRAVEGLMEQRVLTAAEQQRVAHGLSIGAQGGQAERYAAVDAEGRLAAILARRGPDELRAVKNFPVTE